MPFFSIVIPTYNRPQCVLSRVGELLPQLGEGVELVIIDNCSPIVVETLVSENFPEVVGKVRYIRNQVNVGGNANVCRCFEVGAFDWMWILGDDDHVLPDAVANILGEISAQVSVGSLCGFNFSTGLLEYPEAKEFDNLNDYCGFSLAPEHFGNALFISSCVYQSAIARRHLSYAYQSMGSCAPQMVIVLRSILNGCLWRTSTRRIVDWQPPPQGEHWNTFYLAAGLPGLIDVPGCSRAVMDNFHGGLGTTLWRPLLKGGFQMCLFNDDYSSKYWVILFTRLRRLLRGPNRIKLEMLHLVALACWRLPGFKTLLVCVFRALRLSTPFDFKAGLNRI